MIGCDVVKIMRFKDLVDNKDFQAKYFDENEILYINSKNNRLQSMAGIFAVKEAFLKALGIGIGDKISLKEIVIEHQQNGAPVIKKTDKINQILTSRHLNKISISISHDGDTSFAVCQID